ncbi:hypothetical protein J3E71DRAFT_30697 [Bipolaris maydis]|nr:hypothetical protein J3E71DRAFT_30697 [Bipolaris maydis]
MTGQNEAVHPDACETNDGPDNWQLLRQLGGGGCARQGLRLGSVTLSIQVTWLLEAADQHWRSYKSLSVCPFI